MKTSTQFDIIACCIFIMGMCALIFAFFLGVGASEDGLSSIVAESRLILASVLAVCGCICVALAWHLAGIAEDHRG